MAKGFPCRCSSESWVQAARGLKQRLTKAGTAVVTANITSILMRIWKKTFYAYKFTEKITVVDTNL